MIIDYMLMFTDGEGQELSAAAESDYTLDFVQEAPTTGHDFGPLTAVFTVKEDVSGALQISLQDCDEEDGTFADVATAVSYDSPEAGTLIAIPMPFHHKRYVRAYFGGSPSAGTVVGFVTQGFQDNVPPEQAASLYEADEEDSGG